jgi:hypothetical protein
MENGSKELEKLKYSGKIKEFCKLLQNDALGIFNTLDPLKCNVIADWLEDEGCIIISKNWRNFAKGRAQILKRN